MRILLHQKIVQPLIRLLKTGISVEKISLSIAFGIMLGVFPVLGSTTVLCTIAAFMFRLNLPAIQLVNYAVYPLQFFLLIPFFRAGEHLFASAPLPLSLTMVTTLVKDDAWGATVLLWNTTWHAAVVWCMLAPGVIFVIYRLLLPLVRKLRVRMAGAEN